MAYLHINVASLHSVLDAQLSQRLFRDTRQNAGHAKLMKAIETIGTSVAPLVRDAYQAGVR